MSETGTDQPDVEGQPDETEPDEEVVEETKTTEQVRIEP